MSEPLSTFQDMTGQYPPTLPSLGELAIRLGCRFPGRVALVLPDRLLIDGVAYDCIYLKLDEDDGYYLRGVRDDAAAGE